MEQALQLWGEGKNNEAVVTFERISSVKKTNWLPSYYIGLINIIEASKIKDKEKVTALLSKAQVAIDNATVISPDNSEIMVV